MFALLGTVGTATAIEMFTSGFMLGLTAYAAAKETQKRNKDQSIKALISSQGLGLLFLPKI